VEAKCLLGACIALGQGVPLQAIAWHGLTTFKFIRWRLAGASIFLGRRLDAE